MSVVPFGADRIENDPISNHPSGIAQPLQVSSTFDQDSLARSQASLGPDGDSDGRSLTEILEQQPGVDPNLVEPLRQVMSANARSDTEMTDDVRTEEQDFSKRAKGEDGRCFGRPESTSGQWPLRRHLSDLRERTWKESSRLERLR